MAWCRLPCCVFRACIWLSGLSPGLKKSRAAPGWVSWCWGRKGRWISGWEEGQLVWRKVQLSCSLGTGLSRGDCTQGNSKAAAAARVTDCSSKLLAKRAREMRASRGRRVKQPYCCWCTHLESHHKLGLLTSAPNIQCKCFSRGSLWAQFMISVMKTSFLLIKSTGQCNVSGTSNPWDATKCNCNLQEENKRNPKAGPELLIHPVIIGSPETPRAVAAAKWSNQNVNKLHNSSPPPLSTHQHHHRSKRKHDFDNHVHLIPAY